MNKIIACLFVFVCSACAAPTGPVSPPNIAGVIGVGGPVVLIRNSSGGACSAVVMDDDTLLTARHCFLGAGDVSVWTSPQDALNPTPASVADTYIAAAAYDVAVVPLLWPLPPGTRHAHISHKTFRHGDPATIVGWGCMHTGTIEARPVTYDVTDDTHGVMRFVGTSCTGDSGGGVFDNDGAFVATTSSLNWDSFGRVAFINAISWQAVTTGLRLDAIAAKQ